MEIKEKIIGALFVGGAAYGVSQYGLNDVLSEDMRHITSISAEERPAYMEQVVTEFTQAFSTYSIESETYLYEGFSKFTTSPADGTFVEIVTQDSPVPQKEISGLRTEMDNMNFCAQAEMTMFTENGWTYRFSMQDKNGQRVFSIVCQAEQPTPALRGVS